MSEPESYTLRPVGYVRSPLKRREDAPKQGVDGAPEAWLEIDLAFHSALDGISPGSEILVLTWLHLAKRDVVKVIPRRKPGSTLTGVFNTRSPDRPNPVGLHKVTVIEIDGQHRLKVRPLEAIDGTPIVDIKPVIAELSDT